MPGVSKCLTRAGTNVKRAKCWVCPYCLAILAIEGEKEEACRVYPKHLRRFHSGLNGQGMVLPVRSWKPLGAGASKAAKGTESSPTGATSGSHREDVNAESVRTMVACPKCSAAVRSDRLAKHLASLCPRSGGSGRPSRSRRADSKRKRRATVTAGSKPSRRRSPVDTRESRRPGCSWLFRENRTIHELPPIVRPASNLEPGEWDLMIPNTRLWRTGRR